MLRSVLVGFVVLVSSNVAVAQETDDDGLPPQCKSLIPITKQEILKGCAGSGHLSTDPRGKGYALIGKLGSKLSPLPTIKMYTEDGKFAGCMSRYPGNNGKAYKWRHYSNFGCGKGWTRTKIHKVVGKKQPIFLVVKAGGKCIKVEKSYSNINSSQKCG